jgi:hypothetical protein
MNLRLRRLTAVTAVCALLVDSTPAFSAPSPRTMAEAAFVTEALMSPLSAEAFFSLFRPSRHPKLARQIATFKQWRRHHRAAFTAFVLAAVDLAGKAVVHAALPVFIYRARDNTAYAGQEPSVRWIFDGIFGVAHSEYSLTSNRIVLNIVMIAVLTGWFRSQRGGGLKRLAASLFLASYLPPVFGAVKGEWLDLWLVWKNVPFDLAMVYWYVAAGLMTVVMPLYFMVFGRGANLFRETSLERQHRARRAAFGYIGWTAVGMAAVASVDMSLLLRGLLVLPHLSIEFFLGAGVGLSFLRDRLKRSSTDHLHIAFGKVGADIIRDEILKTTQRLENGLSDPDVLLHKVLQEIRPVTLWRYVRDLLTAGTVGSILLLVGSSWRLTGSLIVAGLLLAMLVIVIYLKAWKKATSEIGELDKDKIFIRPGLPEDGLREIVAQGLASRFFPNDRTVQLAYSVLRTLEESNAPPDPKFLALLQVGSAVHMERSIRLWQQTVEPHSAGSLSWIYQYATYLSNVLFALAGNDWELIYDSLRHWDSTGDATAAILHIERARRAA